MKMKEFLKENERYWADRAEGYCQVNIDELRSNKKLEWIDIIKVAGPLLDIIYPVAVTLIVLTLMSNKIKSNAVFNISAIVACLFGVMNVLKVGFIQSLPLAEVGLSWVIPVLIVSVISIVVTSSKSNKDEKLKDTQIS